MEDPAARRARLKALKEAAQLAEGREGEGNEQAEAAQQEPEKVVLKFRNYNPTDQKRIEHEKVAPAHVPKLEEPVIEKESRPEEQPQEELLVSIAPKKANWDLKRDIQPKLDKLERRTQRAIIEIMQEEERQRLQEEGAQD